jgi:hypothetical protein
MCGYGFLISLQVLQNLYCILYLLKYGGPDKENRSFVLYITNMMLVLMTILKCLSNQSEVHLVFSDMWYKICVVYQSCKISFKLFLYKKLLIISGRRRESLTG